MYGLFSKATPTGKSVETDPAIREAKSLMGDTPLNSPPVSSSGRKANGKKSNAPLDEQLAAARDQIAKEKAGKRKLFHSLVKLAHELRRMRDESSPLHAAREYADRHWYEGGLWRAPAILPTVHAGRTQQTVGQAISLSDLFFSLVIVLALHRVGVAVSQRGHVDGSSFLYFWLFWSIWTKEASYSTRFDTTDLSAQAVTLITCFCVLFASLSVQEDVDSVDGGRIMLMGAAVAVLHALLHVRVAVTTATTSALGQHVLSYAVFNIVMTVLEACMWFFGVYVVPLDFRWTAFFGALVLALRFPRAFLANDFHAACSKRGVLFILLLGFLLQSMVVVASEFFEYQTPTLQDYGFLGSACLMFFCIKLLYVDDSDTLAQDHALLVNRWAGFFFHAGNFSLLLSTTVMGSGLNLLTHSYLSATAALPGPAKSLVCGGFAAVLLSTFFIKSMHIRRVPVDPTNQALFMAAYVVQSLVLLAVAAVAFSMALGENQSILQVIYESDMMLLTSLSGSALLVLITSWLDEGVAVALYSTSADCREFRIHPFGFWWCLSADVNEDQVQDALEQKSSRLSALSPLLGSSAASLNYHAVLDGSERSGDSAV